LSTRGGAVTIDDFSKRRTSTLNVLHQTSFLIVASISIVAFSPLPSLTRHLTNLAQTDSSISNNQSPQSQAIQILSFLSSISASIELFASPLMGVWIDSSGRRVPSIILYSLVALSNALVVSQPCVWSICLSKVVNGVVGGFLVIITNAIIADMFAITSKDEGLHAKDQMGSVFGRQAAAVSSGFLSGSLIGGRLTEGGERLAYGCSLIFSILATMNGAFRLMESAEFLRDKNAKDHTVHPHSWDHATLRQKVLEAPLSSVQLLFHYGTKMRTLALLLMLQSAPMFMGDVFQLFAKEYWKLSPSAFGSLIALFGVLGIISNLSLTLILNSLGLRSFSILAIVSSLFFPVTTIFTSSYQPVLIAGCLGLYSGCQKIGTSTAMTALASENGVKQGQLQGEKASMLALLRIICPVVYGMLYLRGKEWSLLSETGEAINALRLVKGWIGTKLPFMLNIVFSLVALIITWKNI
jgi:DHA1 family multidrug resistance protein-like MFS transporter